MPTRPARLVAYHFAYLIGTRRVTALPGDPRMQMEPICGSRLGLCPPSARAVETAFLETLYVLFFIEIGTRRVHVTVSTTNPDSSFVT
jgi:hypothetical protein